VAHALPSLRLQRLSLDHAHERLDDVPVEVRADALPGDLEAARALLGRGQDRALGGLAPMPVLSALNHFSEDFAKAPARVAAE